MRRYQKIMSGVLFLIVLLVLIVGCIGPDATAIEPPVLTSTPAPTKSSTSTRTYAPSSTISQISSSVPDLLPLAVGNTWTYSTTVSEGKSSFFQRALGMKQGGLFITTGIGAQGPLYQYETYTIVSLGQESGSWQVEITASDSNGVNSPFVKKRYDGANKVFWQKSRIGDQDIIGFIDEKIHYERDKLPPGWKEDVVDPIAETRTLVPIFKVLVGEKQSYIKYEVQAIGSNVKVSSFNKMLGVNTSINNFENCVEVKEDVEIKEANDIRNPWSTGWVTYRYFCPAIGLVKELQENRAGEILYYSELIKYNLVLSK